MDETRAYREDEVPSLGDVVRLCGGPYGSGIIAKIEGDWAEVERAHAKMSGRAVYLRVERVPVATARLRELPVYVTGPSGHVDNRNYD
jgi:hypothetical protein